MKKRLALFLIFLLTVTSWAVYTAPNEDTVHFVGGLGTHADQSNSNGGGATKAVWDAGSPSDFIDTNGGPVAGAADCTFTTATKVLNSGSMGATNVVTGTLCYVSTGDGAHITPGIYEITAHTSDTVTCADIDDDGTNDTGVTVTVGGAFATLQAMLDDSSTNAEDYNRFIYVNDPDSSIVVTGKIVVDTGQGDGDGDTWKETVGCNISLVPLTLGNYLTLTAAGNDLGEAIIEIDDMENVIFRNLWLKDNDSDGGGSGANEHGVHVIDNGLPEDILFDNCKITNCFNGILQDVSTGRNLWVLRTIIDDVDAEAIKNDGAGAIVSNCFMRSNTSTLSCVRVSGGGTIANTIIVDGEYGMRPNTSAGGTFLFNVSFYNQTGSAIYNSDSDGRILAINCTAQLADAANDYWVSHPTSGSTYDDFVYTNVTTNGLPSGGGSNRNSLSATQIGFRDAANDDFRLMMNSVCLNAGIPMPYMDDITKTGYSTVGSWQPYGSNPFVNMSGSKFQRRSKNIYGE